MITTKRRGYSAQQSQKVLQNFCGVRKKTMNVVKLRLKEGGTSIVSREMRGRGTEGFGVFHEYRGRAPVRLK